MSSTELTRVLFKKVHRLVRTHELDEIAVKMGKEKTAQHDYQKRVAYYWNENEIQQVIELL